MKRFCGESSETAGPDQDASRSSELPVITKPAEAFRYLKDPVFLTAATIYLLHRWVLKPLIAGEPGCVPTFFRSYLNDVLCIPFCLPPLLFFQRRIGLRRHDERPTRFEIIASLAVWAVFFEGIAPSYFPRWTVGNPQDIAAYAVGAIVAGLIWGSLRSGHPWDVPPISMQKRGSEIS